MKRYLYVRALGIWLLKTITDTIVAVAVIFIIAEHISPILFVIALNGFYLFISFLYAEWIFAKGRVHVRQMILLILVTFLLELTVSIPFFSWLIGYPMLDVQMLLQNAIYIIPHSIVMVAAWYVRKRYWAQQGLAEGLES